MREFILKHKQGLKIYFTICAIIGCALGIAVYVCQ